MAVVAPEIRAVGAKAEGETGETEVGAPAGIATGDLEILIATTIAGGTITISNNGGGAWTEMKEMPINVTGGEKVYLWWRIRAGGDGSPKVKAGSDHVCAGRIAIKTGTFDTATPFEGILWGFEEASDTSFAFNPFQETGGSQRLCFIVCTSGTDSATGQAGTNTANANLTAVNTTPLIEYNTAKGGGGGFWVSHGVRETQGQVGEWTQTMVSATPKAYYAFTVRPIPLVVPLAASAGVAAPTLALTAPTQVPLAAAAGVATATLALRAPTQVPLGAAAGVATTSLALSAKTQIPLGASAGVATTSLALTAKTQIPLGTAAGVATTSLALHAPSPYEKELLKLIEPDFYLRHGEASGPTHQDATANNLDGTSGTGLVFGKPGSIYGDSDTCVEFTHTDVLERIDIPYTVGPVQSIGGRAWLKDEAGQYALFGTTVPFSGAWLRFSTARNISLGIQGTDDVTWLNAIPAVEKWFSWAIKWDLTANTAELIIDGESQGVKEVTTNLSGPGTIQFGEISSNTNTYRGLQDENWGVAKLVSNADLLALHELSEKPVTKVPLGAAAGTSSTSLTLHAATQVPLAASSGVATTSFAIQTAIHVPLGAASGAATTTLAIQTPIAIPLGTSSGIASTSLTIKRGMLLTLAASGVATTSLTVLYPIKPGYFVRTEGKWVPVV